MKREDELKQIKKYFTLNTQLLFNYFAVSFKCAKCSLASAVYYIQESTRCANYKEIDNTSIGKNTKRLISR